MIIKLEQLFKKYINFLKLCCVFLLAPPCLCLRLISSRETRRRALSLASPKAKREEKRISRTFVRLRQSTAFGEAPPSAKRWGARKRMNLNY